MLGVNIKVILTRLSILIAAVTLLITLVLSWIQSQNDIQPFLQKALPEAQAFVKIMSSPLIYEGKQSPDGHEEIKGYVVIADAQAYGGPIQMATGIDLQGKIIGTVIVGHKDTPYFITKIIEKKYLQKFEDKKITDPLSIEKDIDCITGATYSSQGIARAVSLGSHAVARSQFGIDVLDEVTPLKFGVKELAIFALVGLMLIGVTLNQRILRRVTLLCSMVLIGFAYDAPISLSNIAALLMGNFPSIRENLVWYILLIGIPIITLIVGRNVYCFWLCPFGALQEITAKIGGGKLKCRHKEIESKAAKIRYGLVYLALIGAFLTKSPSVAGYEPFATLFGLQGFGIQWLILPMIIFSSFFIFRFWCRFFCPGFILNEVILRPRKYIMEKFRELKSKRLPELRILEASNELDAEGNNEA